MAKNEANTPKQPQPGDKPVGTWADHVHANVQKNQKKQGK